MSWLSIVDLSQCAPKAPRATARKQRAAAIRKNKIDINSFVTLSGAKNLQSFLLHCGSRRKKYFVMLESPASCFVFRYGAPLNMTVLISVVICGRKKI